MKQKYHIRKIVKEKKLLIQEFAVLSGNIRKQKLPTIQDEDFSLLCEQTYQGEEVKKASSEGKDELILLLRNRHFFPIQMYMEKIADTVIAMYALEDDQYQELIFDDKEVLIAAADSDAAVEEIEGQKEEQPIDNGVDDLLEDTSESAADNDTEPAPTKGAQT